MRRNSIWIRILAIVALVAFLAVSILTVIPMGTFAQTAQEKLEEAQSKQGELKEKIDEAKNQISINSKEKQALDAEIAKVQAEIDKLNGQINDSNAKIAAKQVELTQAQENSRQQHEDYLQRAKMMVERGSITYLEVLLNSKSFSDLLSRYAVVKQIVRYDSNRLKELREIEQKIADIKKELEGENQRLVSLKNNETAQMNTLSAKRAANQKIIDDLQKDKNAYEKALAEQEAAEANARAEIKRLTEQSQRNSGGGNTPAPTSFSGGMVRPTSGPITSPYYMRVHPVTGKLRQHTGIDYGSPHGADIVAAASGTVLVAGYNAGGYGNYIVISHGGGVSTLYGHASSLLVSAGQTVTQGQVIAKVGSTGMSTGPHLHFEVLINGQHTNPASYVPG